MNRGVFSSFCLAVGVLLSAGCAGEGEVPAPNPDPIEQAEAVPPVTNPNDGPRLLQPGPAPEEGATASGAGIEFDLPAGWEPQPPANPMRIGQAVIPGPGGPGELAVFFFGVGGGGGTEANLERWAAQIESTDPSATERQSFESGPLTVHLMTKEGTLLPSTMGMGPSEPSPDSMLLAAVVEGPGGPWFFKATGPESTLQAEREAFEEMLRGLRIGQ